MIDPGFLKSVNSCYGPITYFANDNGAVSRSLETYGEWAVNELTFVRQFITPGATVLDVGAYIGTHTLAFADFVGEAGSVIAFEAQPRSFEVLRENVLSNKKKRVRLENVAVGDRRGSVRLRGIDIARESSFGSTSLIEGAGLDESAAIELPCLTLDSLQLARCDLIKIDVEGMEAAVIAGAAETLRRFGPMIYAECNTVEAGLRSLQALRNLGYVARLHVVRAFNQTNFLNNPLNIFGAAKEAALVGFAAGDGRVNSVSVRDCEILVEIHTADDLVLGMLNKPQYADEILEPSAAAATGGRPWLEGFRGAQMALERLGDALCQLNSCEAELDAAQKAKRAAAEELRELQALLAATQMESALVRHQIKGAERRVREAEAQRNCMQTIVNAMERSTVWRVTKPLRATVRWFHRTH